MGKAKIAVGMIKNQQQIKLQELLRILYLSGDEVAYRRSFRAVFPKGLTV